MAGEFVDKVVMITGAGGNLGKAVARRFAGSGARLVLLDRNADRLEALAAELGAESLWNTADLANPDAVEAAVAQAAERFGQIDILAHTVGGYESGRIVQDDNSLELFERQIALNVKPVIVVGKAVARHMLARGVAGKIIIVLARSALKGSAGSAAYTASKAAAQRIMESMSLELRDKGINVNGVLPSTLDTPANRQDMPNADFSKWVTTDQLADVIAFLASPAASALHGVSLEVYNRA